MLRTLFFSFFTKMLSLSQKILSLLGLISGQIVVSARNPIHRIAYLILVFQIGAFVLTLLDFYFLGLTYIIVYVGAIAILFLFVIMMVQIPIISTKTESNYTPHILSSTQFSHFDYSYLPHSCSFLRLNLNSSFLLSNSSLSSLPLLMSPSPNLSLTFSNKKEQINELHFLPFNSFPSLHLFFSLILFFSSFSFILFQLTSSLSYDSFFITNFMNTFTTQVSETLHLVSYFHTQWGIEFKTMTDLENLGLIVYVGYPIALILLSVALWVVMIGVISICTP